MSKIQKTVSVCLNCKFLINSSQSLFVVYSRFTPWTKSWLNLNSSSSRPSASRCSHKRNEKNSCQGKHLQVRVTLRCYYSYFCIIVNIMIITSFSPRHLNLNAPAGECMAVLVHKHSIWILSVQSHRKHWVVCTKPKKSSSLSENHPVKRHSLCRMLNICLD